MNMSYNNMNFNSDEMKEKTFNSIYSGNNENLGGEIFRDTRRRRNISLIIGGVIAFILFNVILYFLTKVL